MRPGHWTCAKVGAILARSHDPCAPLASQCAPQVSSHWLYIVATFWALARRVAAGHWMPRPPPPPQGWSGGQRPPTSPAGRRGLASRGGASCRACRGASSTPLHPTAEVYTPHSTLQTALSHCIMHRRFRNVVASDARPVLLGEGGGRTPTLGARTHWVNRRARVDKRVGKSEKAQGC